jgi:hypothetical protein|tara:strand:- start:13 stop:498 length:486 start_codon:yes stop_codon:yes gene_type:complete
VSKYVKYEKGTVKPENLKKEPKFKMTESSLANLKPKWDNDHMKKMAAKSLEKRRANKEAREKMKETVGILKYLSDGVMSDMPTGLTVMQIMMVRAIQDGDPAEAAKLAATIAEYQQPKLQRTENINTNINMEDLTDDELALQLAKINGTVLKDIEGEVVND